MFIAIRSHLGPHSPRFPSAASHLMPNKFFAGWGYFARQPSVEGNTRREFSMWPNLHLCEIGFVRGAGVRRESRGNFRVAKGSCFICSSVVLIVAIAV